MKKKVGTFKIWLLAIAAVVAFSVLPKVSSLATEDKALTVAEIAKCAKITEDEVLVGMGWLFKEGKIKGEDDKVTLA